MESLGVHHVSINVDDVPAALDFYVGRLGMKQRADRPDLGVGGAWLDVGGQQVHLIEAQVPEAAGQHFAILVDDLDAVVTELRGHGIKVSDPRQVGTGRQSFLRDPAGNQLELQQPGS
jgi:catechol 2,3-dioxygenase-like lactoylglutathione lyase family enzyme